MNYAAAKRHIEESVHEYCLKQSGAWSQNIARYWELHPDERAEYIEACGFQSIQTLAGRFQHEQAVAAAREADDSSTTTQLVLPGVPHARFSPVVEVAPGDWREKEAVAVTDHIAHTDRTTERCQRWAKYHEKKGIAQRKAATAMEGIDPGSSRLPLREVRQRWGQLGLFDEAETPLATAAAVP